MHLFKLPQLSSNPWFTTFNPNSIWWVCLNSKTALARRDNKLTCGRQGPLEARGRFAFIWTLAEYNFPFLTSRALRKAEVHVLEHAITGQLPGLISPLTMAGIQADTLPSCMC
eukprot:m.170605 g.170605  ORF g.170605 m.170605 type:complete len:113 (-) comp16694_c0_seq1:4733-5071(-)